MFVALFLFSYFTLLYHGLVDTSLHIANRPNLRADKPSGPFQYFKTEPDFEAVLVNVTQSPENRSVLAPGYFFLAPFRENPFDSWGPQIVDHDGHVMWYGQKTVALDPHGTDYRRAQEFKVCDYLGTRGKHLCSSETHVEDALNRVLDSSYKPIASFEEFDHWGNPNPHEFNMLPGGRMFIQALYRRRNYDIRAYGGGREGTVYDPCFQEINVKTRKVVFGWCFLDYYTPDETQLYLDIPSNKVNKTSHVAGQGLFLSPWDIAHMNSVDKNEEGDYMISCRHMDQIIKIAGKKNRMGLKPGQTIWRLGGKNQDFEIAGDALFSRQHCARFIKTTKEETSILLFDNAWEGVNEATARTSSAMILTINNSTMKTTLNTSFLQPNEKLSPTRGSVQLLPNDNVAVGWGAVPEYSEFSHDGQLLYHASFSKGPLLSYRVLKYEWEGNPRQPPKIVAYCRTCEMTADPKQSPLVVYASWNGATKLASWRFSIAFDISNSQGPWHEVGIFPKSGFETMAYLSADDVVKSGTLAHYVMAEALDIAGNVLANVSTITFVPKPVYMRQCNARGCIKPKHFTYGNEFNAISRCSVTIYGGSRDIPFWVILVVFIACVEGANLFVLFVGDVWTTTTLRRARGASVGVHDLPSVVAIKES